ncbi:MAG: HlyD family secretion protein [bacterium]
MSRAPVEEKQPEAAVAKPRPQRGRRGPVFLLVLLAAAAAGIYYLWERSNRVTTDDAYVHCTIYQISPRISGTVMDVFVQDNQGVEAGSLMVQLDREPFQLKVREARAALEAARTQLASAQVGLKAAQAEDALVEAKLVQAQTDLDRAAKLLQGKAIAQDRYDQVQTQHRVLTAQRGVSVAQIEVARSKVESSQASLESAETSLADAELMLSYTEIRSPAKGVVSKKTVEKGWVVQAGSPLLAVADLEDVWVDANFKETQIEHVRPGLRATILTDSYPGLEIPAHVESIEAGTGAAFSLFPPENATGNWVKVVQRIPVKVVLDGPAGGEDRVRLRVGMSAEVTVLLQGRPLLPWPLSLFLP